MEWVGETEHEIARRERGGDLRVGFYCSLILEIPLTILIFSI